MNNHDRVESGVAFPSYEAIGGQLSNFGLPIIARPLTQTSGSDGPITVEVPSGQRSVESLIEWISHARAPLEKLLESRKAVLLRGLGINSTHAFQNALSAIGADLLEYSERSTPRKHLGGKLYTSTEYPKNQEIPMHNENSYSQKWPRKILFCCLQPSAEGGATPIADSRAVYKAIPEQTRRSFEDKKVMYIRNYGQGVDLPWQESFQTDDHGKVEAYCRSSGINYEWFDNGEGLHTEQVLPAALRFRSTGERVWFNQAHLFHPSSLPAALRQSLAAIFPLDQMPRNSSYGDGSPFSDQEINEIRQAYLDTRVTFTWEQGDLLVLDNLFYAHGRLPFVGERKVVVAMSTLGGSDVEPV